MTWAEFTDGLSVIARTGSTQSLAAPTVASLQGFGMIAGSEADDGGVYLTESGARWYHRAVVDRENERLLIAFAPTLARMWGRD